MPNPSVLRAMVATAFLITTAGTFAFHAASAKAASADPTIVSRPQLSTTTLHKAATLPPNVTRRCAWPPPSGQAACFEETYNVSHGVPQIGRGTGNGFYNPADLQAAYDLPISRGAGQTVATVDAFDNPNSEKDLAVYRAHFGLPPCTTANGCYRKLNQRGKQGSYPSSSGDLARIWAGESALDVDMISAACPKCRIVVVEADEQELGDLAESVDTAVNAGAKFVSNSYGYPDAPVYQTVYNKHYRHPGVVITASTGDDGYGTSYPAVAPSVVAVGGTSLLHSSSTRGWSEIVWGGAGSGCSGYAARPSWQNTGTGCVNRVVADVSAVADPYTGVEVYNTFAGDPGWEDVGGTSASSPLIAATYALAGTPASNELGAYGIWQNHDSLNDVVSGTNFPYEKNCSPASLCNGGPGWDGPSGWGTPSGIGAFLPMNSPPS